MKTFILFIGSIYLLFSVVTFKFFMENKDKKLCESTDYTSDDWVRIGDDEIPCISFDKEYGCISNAQFKRLVEESVQLIRAKAELRQLRARVADLEDENDRVTTAYNNTQDDAFQKIIDRWKEEQHGSREQAFYNDISSIRDSLNALANR